MTERAQNADFSQKTADFRRFTPSPGNSSIWRAQETTENRRFSQKTAGNRRLGSVTLGASPLARPNAQPRLSRSTDGRPPARGYKFGCVCSYMAGHADAGLMTGHIGTNTPKFVPPRWGRPPFGPTQTGLCKFG